MTNDGIIAEGFNNKLRQLEKEYNNKMVKAKTKEEIEVISKWFKEAKKKAKMSWF